MRDSWVFRPARRFCAVAGLICMVGSAGDSFASTVFNDNLTSSTLNSGTPAAPTSSSTNYDVLGSKASTNSALASGDLTLKYNTATGSGFVEIQALFSTDPTPYQLINVGDTIEYDVTFKDTGSIIAGGTSSYIAMGLYNTGGSGPVNGLNSSPLLSTASGSSYATGGAAGWSGYIGRLAETGGNNEVYLRPPQTGAGTSSANQDAIGNNWGGGAYNNPTGTQIGGTEISSLSLTAGNTYTADMLLTLTATGVNVQNTLYSGAGTGGPALQTQADTDTASTATSFDGLAFGLRNSGTSAQPVADISQISVTVTPAPEPTTLLLLGVSIPMLLRRKTLR